ncbi:MAG: DUF4214 domain-containing protein [Gammaproteobacteria bacterium]|nr:DUF4214 domain-containing protein [Gammaproteobacteria bacterium]
MAIALWAGLLSLNSIANELATSYALQVQKMYVAYYGRPGDPRGVRYWADQIAQTGGNWIPELVNAFGTSEEYTDRFGGFDPGALIDNLYAQLFGRAPDATGKSFYVDLLNGTDASGLNPSLRTSTLAQIAVDIANGAQGEDLVMLDNKLEVASYFTQLVDLTDRRYISVDIENAVSIITEVHSDPLSVDANKSAVDAFVSLPAPTPVIQVESVFVDEGAGIADLEVKLSSASDETVSVRYSTYEGDARDRVDYQSVYNSSLSFAPGEIAKQIRLIIHDDAEAEGDESFGVAFGSATNALIGAENAYITILDDDGIAGTPVIEVQDLIVDEKVGEALLTLTLSGTADSEVSVTYATVPGSASDGDFVAATGSLIFQSGERVKTVSLPIIDDRLSEGAERFSVVLSDPVNARMIDDEGVVIIAASDRLPVSEPVIDLESIVVDEKDGVARFLARLSSPSLDTVSLRYSTYQGTASDRADYQSFYSDLITFVPGETIKKIPLLIMDDTEAENDESFYLGIASPENAVIGTEYVIATIADDDGAIGTPVVGVEAAGVSEAVGTVVLPVRLDLRSDDEVQVSYDTISGSADDADFSGSSGTLTFLPGDRVKTLRLPITDDLLPEDTELFEVALSEPVNAYLLEDRANVTIGASDQVPVPQPVFDVESIDVDEKAGVAEFMVQLSAPSLETVWLRYSTEQGSAQGNTDYLPVYDDFLSFAPGDTLKKVQILIVNDSEPESDKAFYLNFRASPNAVMGTEKVSATILDDD